MLLNIAKHKDNPIIRPGKYSWRKATVFNPAAVIHNDKFYVMERAAGSLNPHCCYFGLLESNDGVNFEHTVDYPVFTPAQIGYPFGSVQDPRIVKIDNRFYLTYALRRFTGCVSEANTNLAFDYYRTQGIDPSPEKNHTISGMAVSDDLIHWENLGFCNPLDVDDRDLVLFPEKINNKYALLRRPNYANQEPLNITLCYSDTLENGGDWSDPVVILEPRKQNLWESMKIGACGPPIKTQHGWLLLYHGVDAYCVYRVGAAILDSYNPEKVLARTKLALMEPDAPWEKLGAVFPNVVFPCGNVVKDSTLYIYYGAADTTICLATVNLQELINFIMHYKQKTDIAKIFAEFASF